MGPDSLKILVKLKSERGWSVALNCSRMLKNYFLAFPCEVSTFSLTAQSLAGSEIGTTTLWGQIVDELAGISHQVDMRGKIGDVALNRLLEDFFKDVLSLVHGWNLVNLNSKRSNEPGLDLGDPHAKVAVQVTSSASSSKVKKTLEKVTTEHLQIYDRILVLAIGNKQGSYTLDKPHVERTGIQRIRYLGHDRSNS